MSQHVKHAQTIRGRRSSAWSVCILRLSPYLPTPTLVILCYTHIHSFIIHIFHSQGRRPGIMFRVGLTLTLERPTWTSWLKHTPHAVVVLFSDDPRCHFAEEEVPAGQVPVCAAHCGRCRSFPLQTQQELSRCRRPRFWVWRVSVGELLVSRSVKCFHVCYWSVSSDIAMVMSWSCDCFVAGLSDVGWFDWCGPGPHEGSLPNKCQPHDAEHQPVVHPGAGTR